MNSEVTCKKSWKQWLGKRSGKFAFSLVEVTMAIGVVSISLLVMLGMMPIGLTALRESVDESVKSQITQHISGEILLTPFGRINNYITDGPYYFTEEGILQKGLNSPDNQTLFQVNLLREVSSYPGTSSLLAEEKNRLDSENLTAIKIAICKVKGQGMVADSVLSDPFGAGALSARPSPMYQVIQLANSYGKELP